MKKSKDLCAGCYNNDYNNGLGGAKECWSYSEAEVVDRIPVHINQMPPYDKKNARKMLNCYRQPQMCYPTPDALDSRGYWKS